jgi:ABC-type nitrate/sulfonate/bicarbonate transport system substrate-binding protein
MSVPSPPIKIRRRTLLRATGGGALAALADASPLSRPAIAQTPTIRYTLSWLPTGQYAFITAAQQLGFWKKRGLNVEVSRGYGSLAAIQAVAGGQFEMGGAQTGADLLSMMKGLDLRLIGTQGYDATLGIAVPADGPIKTAKELEGRKIGVTAAGGDTAFLPAYYRLAGVDETKVTIVSIDSKILEQTLMSGIIDAAVITGLSSIPNFVIADYKFRLLSFANAGLQFYWVSTIATGAYLAKNKEIVGNVEAGLLDGMKYMLLNPAEAVDRHLKEHEELALGNNGKRYVELGVGMTNAIITSTESIENGLGYTDLKKIDQQAALVKQYAAKPTDRALPDAAAFCLNDDVGKVTLTPAEWETVRANNRQYAQLLGRA